LLISRLLEVPAAGYDFELEMLAAVNLAIQRDFIIEKRDQAELAKRRRQLRDPARFHLYPSRRRRPLRGNLTNPASYTLRPFSWFLVQLRLIYTLLRKVLDLARSGHGQSVRRSTISPGRRR